MLKDGGPLVLNTGVLESDGMSMFFGEQMLWSTNPLEENFGVVKDLGMEILFEGGLKLCGERQYWISQRKQIIENAHFQSFAGQCNFLEDSLTCFYS